MKPITIIDYGMGNIKSLYNCLKFLGFYPVLYSEKEDIKSNMCILPGVGAFNYAVNLLEEKKILPKINNFAKNKNNLLLGICLGMQLFFDESDENLTTKGLGIIKGKVKKLSNNKNAILPNVGWLKTNIMPNEFFDYLKVFDNEKFYYVHSYFAEPVNEINQIATSLYNDNNFCAIAVKNKNIIGTQFHPEKSSNIGLEFLEKLVKNSVG